MEADEACRIVYKLSDDKSRYVFHGIWDPEKTYADEFVIIPLTSTGAEACTFPPGTAFANITGSTGDNKLGKPWIKLCGDNGVDIKRCITDKKYYNPDGGEFKYKKDGKTPLLCTDSCLYGGHVIEGIHNDTADHLKGGEVYMIPICSHHNSYSLGNGSGNGTGFYMKLHTEISGKDHTVLKLKGFMERCKID